MAMPKRSYHATGRIKPSPHEVVKTLVLVLRNGDEIDVCEPNRRPVDAVNWVFANHLPTIVMIRGPGKYEVRTTGKNPIKRIHLEPA